MLCKSCTDQCVTIEMLRSGRWCSTTYSHTFLRTKMTESSQKKLRISIDRGGTFTDAFASVPGRDDIVVKLLSVDP